MAWVRKNKANASTSPAARATARISLVSPQTSIMAGP